MELLSEKSYSGRVGFVWSSGAKTKDYGSGVWVQRIGCLGAEDRVSSGLVIKESLGSLGSWVKVRR